MKINLDNIIRAVLLEQKQSTVTVIIKGTYGSLSQQQLQESIGAVHGFRVKARVKSKTPVSYSKVSEIIASEVAKHPDIKPYAGGNYFFIKSDDQNAGKNTYLFNYLVFPGTYEDIAAKTFLKTKKSDNVKKSEKTLQAVKVTAVEAKIGFSTVYALSSLEFAATRYLKQDVNQIYWEQFKNWYDVVKNINKRIDTTPMPSFKDLPDNIVDTDIQAEIKTITNTSDPLDIILLQDNLKSMWENNLELIEQLPDEMKSNLLEFIKRKPRENWDSLMDSVVEITNFGFLNEKGIFKKIDIEVYQKIIQYQTEKITL